MNTSQRGNMAEAAIILALTRIGRQVLIPFGDGCKFDLAYIDEDNKLIRVQCKTARYKFGCIHFNTATQTRGGKRVDYAGEADMFGVYYEPLDQCYLFPVIGAAKASQALRIEPSKNNQAQGVLWAKEYTI